MRSIFVTFAEGSEAMRKSGQRLARQADMLNTFNEVLCLDDKKLQEFNDYSKARLKFEELDSFPLFYRAAKAWVYGSVFSGVFGHFDVVMYADAGCEIPVNRVSKREIQKILDFSFEFGGLAERTGYIEEFWTKDRLLKALMVGESIRQSGQIQATWSCLRIDKKNGELVDKWISLSHPDLGLWQNPKGLELDMQPQGFVEHRRDQSIFSLLWKIYNLPTKEPYYEYGARFGLIRGSAIPLHAVRNRNGVSSLDGWSNNDFVALSGHYLNKVIRFARKLPQSKCSLFSPQ